MIEDKLLTAGTLVLNLTLLPTLLDRDSKVSRWTSVPTAIILLVFSITYLSLDLVFTSIAVALGSMIWSLIAVYRS